MKNLVLLFLLSVSLPVAGQVPATLSYQGILMQTDGVTPLPDGEHSIQFSFYTAPSGGTALFTRTLNVATVKGLFTCIIGDGSVDNAALPSSLGTQQLYIGLSVDEGSELEPRTRLTSAPYSFAVAPNDSGPGPVPAGGIIMWSGPVNAIPQGYRLCDGTNGAPDLRGKFIVGYQSNDADYNAIGNTGGEKAHTLTINEMPSHNHGGSTGNRGVRIGNAYTQPGTGVGDQQISYFQSDVNHNHSISAEGGGQSHENRPPYFVLAFIMKK